MGKLGKMFTDEPMAAMFFLWPWVWKINVQGRGAVRWQQIFQKIGRFNADTAQIRQPVAPALFVKFLDASEQALDADEIFPGVLPRIFDKERRITTAKFHFERLRLREKPCWIDGFQDCRQVAK